MNRDKTIETVKEFPQEFELEDLMERLVFIEKIEKGIQQADQGKVTSHEKLKELRKKW
jgi:predicted transcriptional regulator